MSSPEQTAKIEKKAIKAAAKIAKKQRPAPVAAATGSDSPAMRSAEAAERKVVWDARRFWVAIAAVLVASAALLAKLFLWP